MIKNKISFKFYKQIISVSIDADEFDVLKKSNSKFIATKNANKITLKDSFFKTPVPNKIRFILKFNEDTQKWFLKAPDDSTLMKFEKEKYDKDLKISEFNIFLILESPHKDEYNVLMEPIGPAIGTTGNNLFNYFTSHALPILETFNLVLNKNNQYNFCLINPVPFQSSLGHFYETDLLPKTRNIIWKELYKYTFSDFEKLFDTYKPAIIINSCTTTLKKIVQNSIDKKISDNSNKFSTSHPSIWSKCFSNFKKI